LHECEIQLAIQAYKKILKQTTIELILTHVSAGAQTVWYIPEN